MRHLFLCFDKKKWYTACFSANFSTRLSCHFTKGSTYRGSYTSGHLYEIDKTCQMRLTLVLNLTTTCTDGKWAVIWPPNFATRYVSFATNFYTGKQVLAPR